MVNQQNHKLMRIHRIVNRLNQKCNNTATFIHQLTQLMHHDGKHTLEEIIIIYSYMSSNIQYLFEYHNTTFFNQVKASVIRLIHHCNQLNDNPSTDRHKYPLYLMNHTLEVLENLNILLHPIEI